MILTKNMNNINEIEEEEIIITLTLDNGNELECKVITVFEVNNKNYIALLPGNAEDDEEEGEVLLFRYKELEDDEISIENIDTDEEFDIALQEFDKLIKED